MKFEGEREEVFEAITEGLKHFQPPQVDTAATLSRNEILEAVRECLEEFEFPIAPSAMNNDLTRDDVFDAVQEGLKTFDFPDNSAAIVPHADNSEVMSRLHDIMQVLQQELKAAVTTNGQESERVMEETKDGLEQLRTHLEAYIDRLSGGSGQEELVGNLVSNFDSFRDEVSELLARASDGSRNMMKEEIESLRDAINSQLVPHVPPTIDNREALEALREGIERIRHELLRPHAGTTDILDALHEGFGDMRATVEKIVNRPADLTANDEILEALQDGLSSVRTEIDALREQKENTERALATIGGGGGPTDSAIGISDAMVPADMLKHDDIKNLESMMTQLRLKMEEIGTARPGHAPSEDGPESAHAPAPAPAPAPAGSLSKEDLSGLEEMLHEVQTKVASLSSDGGVSSTAEIEESLRNLQASVASI